MRKVQHILWGLLGIGLLIPLEGCGTRPAFGKVSGTVTLDGLPLAGVTVYFLPNTDKGFKEGRRSFGITNKEGKYHLLYEGTGQKEGALVGWHKVLIEDTQAENARERKGGAISRTPLHYASAGKTPLEFEVTPGDQTIDLRLTSR